MNGPGMVKIAVTSGKKVRYRLFLLGLFLVSGVVKMTATSMGENTLSPLVPPSL